jgi:hypothetical protein
MVVLGQVKKRILRKIFLKIWTELNRWHVCGDERVFSARMNAFWLTKDLCTRHVLRKIRLCYGGISVSGHMGIPIFCFSLFTATFSSKRLHGKCSIWKHLKDKCVTVLSLLPDSLVVWCSGLYSGCTQRSRSDHPSRLRSTGMWRHAGTVHRYHRFGRTCCFFQRSKYIRNIVACESGYTASRKTKHIRTLTSSAT